MNTSALKKALPALALLGLAACQPELDAPAPATSGSANFTRYIAVGNSLTAGFSDGGLYLEGQQNSYPNILAGQFKLAGGGDFAQPLFTDAQRNGSGYLRLAGFDANGSPITAPVTTNLAIRGASPTGGALYTRYDAAVNNLGVPGIRMDNVQTVGYGSVAGNPYFERITPTTNPLETYFQRVKREAATATFFTSWLGNNDVLGYSTSGGASTAATNTITRTDTFALKATRIINVLTAGGAKGVIATVPDVSGIPFFTTVGPRLRTNLSAAGVPGLVITTGSAFGGPTSANRKTIAVADIRDAGGSGRQLFTLTSSPFVGLIGRPGGRVWRYLYAQSGQPAAGFPAFLTAYGVDTTKALGVTPENPFPSAFVLDDVEQAAVATATLAYNTTLRNLAATRGLALFDANTFFNQVATSGFGTNGVANTAGYISGNLFSLDGVHPTPRGYAVVANEMIKAINAQYGATLPYVNPNTYRGVTLP
ncbi:G-D-S-L family lipolytic protein [Hymenobacter metallilatus]|uniref:G-D-S-L family lipolytic protein n=1 Tax=Hymenobacter metallilatus TaxID=2493666 RepID=A0A428JFK5_9BACT|nr:G-D-S-L family lipolytic protein [Hymenobacter metallilatus]RSK31048.1 G-D-S-L family lipolytic protein [Hymenobacter metallilatus]